MKKPRIRYAHLVLGTFALLLAACGSGGGESSNVSADVPATEAELARDAALANEAAADEAADMNNFGGNAAAMDAGNGG